MAQLRVAEVLQERGMSADDLYRLIVSRDQKADISRNTIVTMMKNPDHRPNMAKLEIIAQALGVKIADLIDENA